MTLRQQILRCENAKAALLDLVNGGIIDDGTAIASIIMEERKLKKEFVLQKHSGIIKKKKRIKNSKEIEYWWSEVRNENGSYNQITATTEDKLIDKLFAFYSRDMSNIVTLEDAYNVWHKEREKDAKITHIISGRTWDDDEDTWNRFWAKSKLAKMKIKAITVRDILNECKEITGNGKITKKAFDKAMNPLNLIYDMLLEENLVDFNIAQQVPKSKLKFRAKAIHIGEYYTKEQRDILLQYLYNLPKQTVYTLAVALAACLGKRLAEIRALTWDDYNVETRELYIRHQIVLDYASLESKRKTFMDANHVKSYQEYQIMPLSNYAIYILEQLRKINGNKPYILNSAGELPIDGSHFNEHLRSYCIACGIEYYPSHKFRFYGASEMYAQGIPEEEISAFLNHSSVETTRMYDRRRKTMRHETAEAVYGFNPA